jgi:Ca-activated chloride channel family protein
MLSAPVRLLVLALALLIPRPMATAAGGRITGHVRDSAGAPIANAQVSVVGTSLRTATDSSGAYVFESVPAGTYALRAQFIGYTPAVVTGVHVLDRRTAAVELRLQASATTLSAIAVNGVADAVAQGYGRMEARTRAGYAAPSPGASEPWRVQRQPGDREQYDKIDENPFLAVSAHPLSTFSVDVDRASYSNVRRFIMQGQRPPKDAVRIEELVNYFPYSYAEPDSDDPVAINAEVAPAPWKPAHRLVRIGLQAHRIATAGLPPSNFVFLIDVSGSMMPPNKLPLLKAAFRLLVNELRPRDRVAIVVYAGSAGLVLPSTPGDQKSTILEAIERLEAGGSTAGGEGIRRAYDEAVANFVRGGNNRVILATDGDFNVGVSSDAEMVRLIEDRRQTGVFLTVLGVGEGNLQAAKMEKLADRGNGNYAYIDNLLEARKVLVHELGGTLYTVAKDVKIQIEFNPARVRAYRLIGYENRLLRDEDFADDTKDAGEIGSGHSVTALYEVIPAGAETDVTIRTPDSLRYQTSLPSPQPPTGAGDELLYVKVRYKQPAGDRSRELTRPVREQPGGAGGAPSVDFRFQAAVAEFGLLLRESEFKGVASFDHVVAAARGAAGADPDGYRAEFVRLVQMAQSIGLARGGSPR